MDYCLECGAAYPSNTYTEGSDVDIYPELARANLLRMRGEYKQAEEVCLKVLRRYPNNSSANTLLGDISAECGELDQAISWYELALDLVPESKADQEKLAYVKHRKNEHEAATTAQLLGLPTTRSKGVLVAVTLLVFIVLVGITSYYVGRRIVTARVEPRTVIDIPVEVPDSNVQSQEHPATPEHSTTLPTSALTVSAKEDKDLHSRIRSSANVGERMFETLFDPRTKQVVLTYSMVLGEDARLIGAHLAVAALNESPQTHTVVIRAVLDGSLAMVADVTREDLDKTLTTEWKTANEKSPEAWVNALVSNEWWMSTNRTEQVNP
jgi:hypothetical protein